MKIAIAGAFGHLGFDILRCAIEKNYDVVALDLKEKEGNIYQGKYTFFPIDVTNAETLKGTLNDVDVVVTTVGLVSKSAKLTNYDIDYQGNLNLLEEAKRNGVKKFVYISVIHAETAKDVPMLDSKYQFELKLKESGLSYSIIRPTGYFYDIAHVFMPMIEKGKVTLLGRKDHPVNVIDTSIWPVSSWKESKRKRTPSMKSAEKKHTPIRKSPNCSPKPVERKSRFPERRYSYSI